MDCSSESMAIAWGDGPITWQHAIRVLTTRIDERDAIVAAELARIEALVSEALAQRMLTTLDGAFYAGKAGVVIVRRPDGTIHAQHIVVRHTQLLGAEDGIHAMSRVDVAFVRAQDAGAVLDALGVMEESHGAECATTANVDD